MKKRHPSDLLDSIETETTISCSRCKEKDSVSLLDMFDAVDSFFKDGWRATPTMTYCPKCAKKFLKPEKLE